MRKQKHNFFFIAFSLVFFFSVSVARAEKVSVKKSVELHECEDENLGVKFLCNPDWELETIDNTLFIIISSDPDPIVTLTIAKSEEQGFDLDQLTPNYLEVMGQYAEGFSMGLTQVAGLNAVKVEGHPQKFLIAKLYDHYIVHDLNLYTVLFSINPKENWGDYQNLVYKIIESFQFMDQNEVNSDLSSSE